MVCCRRFVMLAILVAIPPLASGAPVPVLKEAGEFELPGPPGKRFDYLAVVPSRHLLLSAHMGAGQLYVIDTRTNTIQGTVPGVPLIEGVECVSQVGKVYCSDAGDDTIAVVDLNEMKVVKRLKTERKPDGSTYAAPFHTLFVSDERGKAVAIVDVTRDEIVKTLHFDSETGMPQYDPVGKLVYVNLQDKNVVAAIDPATNKVVGRYAVTLGDGNHGMALDPAGRRAFLACEGNSKLVVFDLEKHVSVAAIPVPPGVDVVKYDSGLGRVYAACYSGSIAVIERNREGEYVLAENIPVPKAVHSLAVDPETHRVYAPAQTDESGKPSAKMLVFDAVREKGADPPKKASGVPGSAPVGLALETTRTITFEDQPIGPVAGDWKMEATRPAEKNATWEIVAEKDGSKTVTITRINHESGGTFNLLWTNRIAFRDGTLSARIRGNTGKEDQGGGLIWRVQDTNNYYIARYNPLEENLRLYYVKEGRRSQIGDASPPPVRAGTWFTLKIRQEADHIIVGMNGKDYIDVHDDTFTGSGGVGFWSKADAASSFDDLTITPATRKEDRARP